MANRKGRRRFGWVRKLPSGRYQASYLGPDSRRRGAPETFERKGDADRWLSVVESEILRGEWVDPLLGRVTFAEFGKRWITEHRLSERTREEYLSLWRHPVVSFLGSLDLAELTTGTLPGRLATLLRAVRPADRAATAYRLLPATLPASAVVGRINRIP